MSPFFEKVSSRSAQQRSDSTARLAKRNNVCYLLQGELARKTTTAEIAPIYYGGAADQPAVAETRDVAVIQRLTEL